MGTCVPSQVAPALLGLICPSGDKPHALLLQHSPFISSHFNATKLVSNRALRHVNTTAQIAPLSRLG